MAAAGPPDGNGGDLKAQTEEDAYDELEQEFAAVLEQLQSDPALASFRDEYEKLHEALKKSHYSEKRLMAKCRELNAELVTNTAKVESVLKATQGGEDEESIESLQKEADTAWKMVEQSRGNEAGLKTEIEQLKAEISELNETIAEGGTRRQADDDEEDITELLKQKKSLSAERDQLQLEMTELRAEVAGLTTEHQESEEARLAGEQEVSNLQEQLAAKKADAELEARKKANMERQLAAHKQEVEKRRQDVDDKEGQVQGLRDEIKESEGIVAERQAEIETLHTEQEAAAARTRKLEKEMEASMVANQNAFEDNAHLKQEVRARDEELHKTKEDVAKLEKANEAVRKRLKAADEKRLQVEGTRDSLKTELSAMERELTAARHQVEADRKQIEVLARTRDVVTKKLMTAGRETDAQEALVKMHENTKQHLEQEITLFQAETEKQRNLIHQLERERDRHTNEVAANVNKTREAYESVKVAENQVTDMTKAVAAADNHSKQLQAQYEAIRSDRNMYSKNYSEAQDEIGEVKQKLKMMSHQIEQLKEEINSKETALLKEHAAHEAVEGEKVKLSAELDRLKMANSKHAKAILQQQAEEQKLRKIVGAADDERGRQQKLLDDVAKEKHQLKSQLVRRTDELSRVEEKTRLQQANMGKGESMYEQRLEDIKLLKAEIKKLRREKITIEQGVANVDGLKRELVQVQRELMKEKLRCKALEEELETPMNVHRWRKLEGSDPDSFEKIQKIQTLQRRLIAKTEEVVEKDGMIQAQQQRYLDLKKSLSRQPGPEAAEQLQLYKKALKDKNKQLKSMASELNMFQAQVHEYQYEKDMLARELQDVKRRYFEKKRKEQLSRDTMRASASLSMAAGDGQLPASGGYRGSMKSTLPSLPREQLTSSNKA